MPIDASIALGVRAPKFTSPQEMYAQKARIDQNELANRLGGLQLKEFEQKTADKNQLRSIYSQFGTDTEANMNALYRGGRGTEAAAYGKSQAEARKARTDGATASAKLFKDNLGLIVANPTPETVMAVLDDLERQTGRPAGPAKQIFANAKTPEQIAEFAKRMGIELDKQTPTYQTRNTGGTTDTLSIDPITGKVAVANSVRNTQSPESIASNAQSERNSLRTDARQRESNQNSLTKPFEITGEDGKPILVQQDKQGNIRPVTGYLPKQGASKPLTEGQSKALLFGSRMQEAGAILEDLALQGTTKSVPGSRTAVVGPAITAVSGEKNQKLEQAKRDFINATLRRESGAVIADSEFDNAEKQYFPQIGDTPAVIAQKKRNREVATRGILAEVPDSENRVAKVRAAPAPAAGANIDALLDKYK